MRLYWIAVFLCLFATTSYIVAEARNDRHAGLFFSDGTEPAVLSTERDTSARIMFVGDILLARAVERTMDAYGSDHPYQYLEPLFASHTFQVGNFEASVPADHVPTRDFHMRFSVDQAHLPALAEAGFTHLSLANNHSDDFGSRGMTDTARALEQEGFSVFGIPYAVSTSSSIEILDHPEERIALIGIDLSQGAVSKDDLSHVFSYTSKRSDMQIVYVHWGTEYHMTHSRLQESYARTFVALGADLVIGHHPHVIQDVALYNGVPVFYSLGNFIFDQYFSDEVLTGLVLSLSFNGGSRSIELIPVSSAETLNAPQPIDAKHRDAVLYALSKRSDPVLEDAIQGGTLEF